MTKPVELKLHQKSRVLEIAFDDGFVCNLTCEYLRVHSPSAEVRGHGPGQEVLQLGKENVGIDKLEPAGNYAVKLFFDDGHSTGIYTWTYLYELGKDYEENWNNYLAHLKEAGQTRQAKTPQG